MLKKLGSPLYLMIRNALIVVLVFTVGFSFYINYVFNNKFNKQKLEIIKQDELLGQNIEIINKHTSIWECWNGDTGIYSRGDSGLICTPGMSSNVGAGDVIGTILMSHGFDMYALDGVLPLVPVKNFHIGGLLISIDVAENGYVLTAKKAEKQNGVLTINNGEKLVKVFISDGESIKM